MLEVSVHVVSANVVSASLVVSPQVIYLMCWSLGSPLFGNIVGDIGAGSRGIGLFGSPYGNCGFLGGGGLSGITCDCLPRTGSRGGLGFGSALGGNGPAPARGPSFGGPGGAGKASILRLGSGGQSGAGGLS